MSTVLWITNLSIGFGCIGLVVAEDSEGRKCLYIGLGSGGNEESDTERIKQWGTRFSIEDPSLGTIITELQADKLERILKEIEEAYFVDIFPELTKDEINEHSNIISRNSAAVGRHLAEVIRRKMKESEE